MQHRSLLARAAPAAAALAAATPSLVGWAATAGPRLHVCASAAAVEKAPHQTGSAEGAQKPFVQGERLAEKREMREAYEGVLHERSGTAEDASVLDQAQSSLGSMTQDPRAVDQAYAQSAREDVVAHGGREREHEDEGIAEAVFDQTRSDKGYDESISPSKAEAPKYSKPPTESSV